MTNHRETQATMKIAKWGCATTAVILAIAFLAFFSWPYRAESIEGVVVANSTACKIWTTSNGGWREEAIAPGIHASRVAYPLDVRIFVTECRGVAQGRPYSTELVSLNSGRVVARGLSCAAVNHVEDGLCRLELPPLAALDGRDRFIVRVARTAGGIPGTAEVHLVLQREWRSVVIDGMM